jgi:hypothetical protein
LGTDPSGDGVKRLHAGHWLSWVVAAAAAATLCCCWWCRYTFCSWLVVLLVRLVVL